MGGSKKSVLVFGDTHEPYSKDGYIDFLKSVSKKYKCNHFVHLGDMVDFHAISTSHQTEPDAMSGDTELDMAIDRLKPLYKAFPEVTLIMGNHDDRVRRAASVVKLSSKYLKDFRDIVMLPRAWKVVDKVILDSVLYIHGMGYLGIHGARNAAIDNRQSTVIGHLHSSPGISFLANDNDLIFGMNVGCLVNAKSYAMKYAQHFRRKPVVSCGIVIDGKPYLETMDLGSKIKYA